MNHHVYADIALTWTGNQGSGTSSYNTYSRNHDVASPAGIIHGSADPAFRGDPSRWDPEQLLVVSIAQCHMLWYLHLAMAAGVIVTAYEDHPVGVMTTDTSGAGQFEQVTLHPQVTISLNSDPDVAMRVHAQVGDVCFIARSVNFPIHHDPTVEVA